MPVWLSPETAPAPRDSQGTRRAVPAPLRLHRTSRVARRQRVFPFALRRSGDPDARRRRRMGHRQPRLRPRQPHHDHRRTPFSALAWAALFGLHLLLRLPRQFRRIQTDGLGPLRRADLCRDDPPEADRPEGRRLVSHGHVVLPLLPRTGDDLAEVRRGCLAARRGGPRNR